MLKGNLVCFLVDSPIYDQPVGVNDQIAAIRHHAGIVQRGQHAMVLSEPDDWKTTPRGGGWFHPWSKVLVEGRVAWVTSHFLEALVQAEDCVVY